MMIRTFIALEIPDDVKNHIFNLINTFEEAKLFKWEQKHKIHLTLKFIGDIDNNLIPQLIEKLNFLNNIPTKTLELYKFELLYHKKDPKIFWARLNSTDELIKLVSSIEDCLSAFGIEKERRKFIPHLTLLRIKNGSKTDFLSKLVDLNFEPIVFEANKIVFYKSELLPSGSVYKSLHKFQLKKTELK